MDIRDIRRNESSVHVAALQQALAQLGLTVAEAERDQYVAGADTLKKVRAFQQQRGITPDDAVVADVATLKALTDALQQRGMLDDAHAFWVRGTVRGADGVSQRRAPVMAFDVDLRGAAIYRQVKTLAELQRNGGFEFLGAAEADAEGRYSIKFYDWQYRRAERKKADVIVFAVDNNKDKPGIAGRSRLVVTEDFSAQGQVSELDVMPDAADRRTEYAALMDALDVFLKESKVRFADIAANRDQLNFTAGEIDVPIERLSLAAQAERLLGHIKGKYDRRGAHEMLYGIGRQEIALSLDALQLKTDAELQAALARSAEQRIVAAANADQLTLLLRAIRSQAVQTVLEDKSPRRATLNAMMRMALPEASQRAAFLEAVSTFSGTNYADFWRTHLPAQPEFKDNPALIGKVQLTQQLTQISGNHTTLVSALLENRKVDSIDALFELERDDWHQLVRETGLPDSVPGTDDAQRAQLYVEQVQNLLNAAFPTKRIAQMVRRNTLPIEKSKVARTIDSFLKKTPHFDISTSRLHQFDKELKDVAKGQYAEVRAELAKIQRTFQVSPTPEAMAGLMEHALTSATDIAAIPRKNFIRTYGNAVGGEHVAYMIHQRATQVAARSEMTVMRMLDYTQAAAPAFALGGFDIEAATAALANHIPNYAELFGSPDLCECQQCRSVYGAAAYFVDLLRFLWRGDHNASDESPLDLLKARRPDLLELPLTCENTNTIIPYIDLGNEVMEYYAAHDSLTNYKGYDTGEATAQELRANPQNFDVEAYRNIKDARYPFSLPYHQPLDTMRVFGEHLKASRYDVLTAINPQPDATAAQAIAAESLKLSQEEYRVLTGEDFDGTADATALHTSYGLAGAGDLESLKAVREFMRRTGVSYKDLVEIVKTQFVNPYQATLDFLQGLFSYGDIDANTLYTKLGQIEADTLDPAADAGIVAAINAYNAARGTSMTAGELAQWVADHLAEFRQVITLYEPDSKCDLDTTELRTIQRVYEGGAASGVTNATWTRLHRFIRLWRKLGLTVHETDLLITALGESDVTPELIAKLEQALRLKSEYKLAINQLAVFWGGIDAYGDKSLYKKLFLNKAVQQIDTAFMADAWGDYLQDETAVIGAHLSAILAAFRIREEDLQAILTVARVVDAGVERALDTSTDILNLGNLSTVYRYVLLAKALKMKVIDLCTLVGVSGATPFSLWDVQAESFGSVDPEATADFIAWAAATKEATFKAAVLQYVVQGVLPADSNVGLNAEKVAGTVTAIRGAFTTITQDHPDAVPSPLAPDALHAKLSLTFDSAIATRLLGLIAGTAVFETVTDNNLDVTIPDSLAAKYTYIRASGRLIASGVMTDAEQTALKALANTSGNFDAAVDELYAAPEQFLADHFTSAGGVFGDIAEAERILLDHPAQAPAATADERLAYVYQHYLPVLKTRLRRDAITQHIASLIGLSEAATGVLIEAQIDSLIDKLSTEGFSATYYSDATWTAAALQRTDATVDFDWDAAAPDAAVPANNFSVRWRADIAAPASGEYTLVVTVAEADEAFRLYLDDALILEKAAAGANLSLEVIAAFNASQLHRLALEYAETAQNAAVHLQWKRASSGLEIIPGSVAYPSAIVDEFSALATTLHRAARFITTFKLTDAEVNHFVDYAADFGIDFSALTIDAWQRVYDYVALRNDSPQVQASLVDVFVAANVSDPAPSLVDLKALLCRATAWDTVNVDYLADSHFVLAVDDFKNEIALNRLRDVMRLVTRTGLSAETLARVGAVETDFDALHGTAQLLKNTVKAKYDEDDWLTLAGELSDKLRRNQQQALIAYLLTRPAIQAWGATDADSLFEYFLIDVQMGACMDTSRIVQANSSVQMFVNRCLLNLESDLSTGNEIGVSPSAIDKERWEWMKNYRVWEANRKVFLYPENWLEPEWRNDRSEFFRDLESYLVQNDITDTSVEQAFRNYLSSLNEVASLDVCGVHRENYDDGTLKCLHVFARTHAAPYKFFYRRWNEYRKWSAWEKLPIDVRMVEAGINGGVQLIPVVWKNRLFLFWPEFNKVENDPGSTGTKTAESASEEPLSTFKAKRYYEIRLGYSEYVDNKWTPKKLTREFIEQFPDEHAFHIEKDLLFKVAISPTTQQLTIIVLDAYFNVFRCSFIFDDIQSPVFPYDFWKARWIDPVETVYQFFHNNRLGSGELQLEGDTYLRTPTTHRLLPVDTQDGLNITLDDPFFFKQGPRSYFVRPVNISIVEWVRHPEVLEPFLPGLVDDSGWHIPYKIPPEIGPDDYLQALPAAGLVPKYDGGRPALYFGAGVKTGEPVMLADDYAGATEIPVPVAGKVAAPRLMRDAPGMLAALDTRSAPVSAMSARADRAEATAEAAYAYSMGTNLGYSNAAFAGIASKYGGIWDSVLRFDRGLEFHTFYHPYSAQYVTDLNRGGLPRLMTSDTTLPSDEGTFFEDTYDPNFSNGFVQKPADFAERTYYKENVCFDVYGANSIYNWELFFHAPLYIATRLSKNGQYEQAMKWFHYIFDPTTDALPAPGQSETSRYWNVLPFKTTPVESLEDWFRTLGANDDPAVENATIAEWRDNPFDPHLVASNRPLAYMKHVVMKYVENLLAWGDSRFRQDTMESVNEALQIYVIANHILGPRPEFVPERGEIKAESYASLEARWDDFSNALVELENIFPYSSETLESDSANGANLLGVGPALYFCIPANDKLLKAWDTVADRLYKIRHCQNIDGVFRKLALFAPPIDPAALIQAASQGLSLGSILADLSSPPPIYRFDHLLGKANEFCVDVKSLGSALLSALEKKDVEALAHMRATHEVQMMNAITAVRQRQVLDARVNQQQLEKARDVTVFRLRHYLGLLGNDSVTIPPAPSISANLTEDSALPADTSIPTIANDVDVSLVEGGETGVKLIPREQHELLFMLGGGLFNAIASLGESLAGTMNFIPTFSAEIEPFGCGASISYGGSNIAGGISGLAKIPAGLADLANFAAAMAGKLAGHIRREQEWTFQANVAAKEIIAIDKQITSAQIRVQIAEKELENHRQAIANSEQVEQFLTGKFTNQELYQWMKEQLFAVYKQSYNLVYDMAKKAEKAYRYEMGAELASFIQYGYWDNQRQGLLAGDRLQLALRQLEQSYLDENRRELEIVKSVSLARLNPLALIELRETGRCYVRLPEELFDLDFQGHYFRRIRNVRLSIPCIAGPYTSVNCTLRLLNNSLRVNTAMNSSGNYEHENDEGVWIDDDRFRVNHVPVTAIATSTAQADSGLFEFNFRDERYLPFEYAGAISEWQIELTMDDDLRQFDYSTISDVVLHLGYTARENAGLFRERVVTYLRDFIANAAELSEQPLKQLFSLKHEFPSEWYRFLHPPVAGDEQQLTFTPARNRFPFFARNRAVTVMGMDVLARSTTTANYHLMVSYTSTDDDAVDSTEILLSQVSTYGELHQTSIDTMDAGMNLEELNVDQPVTLRLKRTTAGDYTGLATQPDELDDVMMVVHYRLA